MICFIICVCKFHQQKYTDIAQTRAWHVIIEHGNPNYGAKSVDNSIDILDLILFSFHLTPKVCVNPGGEHSNKQPYSHLFDFKNKQA